MNERPTIRPPEQSGHTTWLDAYMPGDAQGPSGPRPQFFNFVAIRGIIYRQRWLVGSVIIIALLAGLITTLLSTPMYQANAKVSVKPFDQYIVEGQSVDQRFLPNQFYDYLATQIEVLKSRSLAQSVVAALDLTSRNDLFGKDIDADRPAGISDAQWQVTKEQMAVSLLTRGVVADVPVDNWVIVIGFRSESPALATTIANGYADAFIETGSRSSAENNQYALTYLKEQIDETRQRLAEAEQVANAYARNTGIILNFAGDREVGANQSTLTSDNLSKINARAAEARAERIEAEQKWRTIQNLPAAELADVQANPALQTLASERAQRTTRLAELRQRYNDNFPQIADLLAQIKVLDTQIERTGADVKAAARSQFLIAQRQERALAAELASLTSARLVEQDQQVELSALEREAQALRETLSSLLDRYNQINSAANLDPGTISKIDSAMVPKSPYAPSILRNLGFAMVLGVGLAAGLAVLRETLDDRIRSLEEIEQKVGLALLGHTPFVEGHDIDVRETNRFGVLIEAYSSIRAAIDFTLPRDRNVIQLTSSQAGEGKSTTAVILAELFAGLGRKTLLVDADLRRPSIASLLGIERPKVGLVEVLLGHVGMEEAVVKGVHENLEILPVGALPPNPTEILASREMREFIEKYRHDYALIIFDSSPILGLADAPILADLVDGTVFILEANRLPFGQARAALRRLALAGSRTIGVVLTKYRALEAGQADSYQYDYYTYGQDK